MRRFWISKIEKSTDYTKKWHFSLIWHTTIPLYTFRNSKSSHLQTNLWIINSWFLFWRAKHVDLNLQLLIFSLRKIHVNTYLRTFWRIKMNNVMQSLCKKRHHGPGCEKEWKPPKRDPSIWWRWLNELAAKAPSVEEQDLKKSSKTHAPSVSMKGSLPSPLHCGDEHDLKAWENRFGSFGELNCARMEANTTSENPETVVFCLIFNSKYNICGQENQIIKN